MVQATNSSWLCSMITASLHSKPWRPSRIRPQLILVVLVAFAALVIVDLGVGAVSAANLGINFGGSVNRTVFPVEVQITTSSFPDATGILVGRGTMKRNLHAMRISAVTAGRTTWREPQAYFLELVLVPDPVLIKEIDEVVIRIGPNVYTYTWSEVETDWQEIDISNYQNRPNSEAIGYVFPADALGLPPGSLFETLAGTINYRGDLRAASWSVVRVLALLLSMGILFAFWRGARALDQAFAWVLFCFAVALSITVYVLRVDVASVLPQLIIDISDALNPPLAWGFTGVLAILLVSKRARAEQTFEHCRSYSCPVPYFVWVCAVTLLALLLRVWSLDFLQAVDTFSITAARALNDTGSYAYQRNAHITHFVAFMFRNFGTTLAAARVPFVLIGSLTTVPVMLIAKQIGHTESIVAGSLFALSPVAIEKAAQVREYSENLFVTVWLMVIIVALYRRYRTNPIKLATASIAAIAGAAILLLLYSDAVDNRTILSAVQVGATLGFCIVVAVAHNAWPTRRAIIWSAVIGLLATAWIVLPRFGPFSNRIVFQPVFVEVYFNPFATNVAQWFSFQHVSALLLACIVFCPLCFQRFRRNPVYLSLLATFLLTVALFTLRLEPSGRSRYIYHLHAAYVIVFSVGFTAVIRLVYRSAGTTRRASIIVAVLVLSLISPVNTIHAVLRHKSRYYGEQQITHIGTENRLYQTSAYLSQIGLQQSDPILFEGQRPDLLSWLLDRPVTRSYILRPRSDSGSGTAYDSASDVYFVGFANRVDERELALKAMRGAGRGYFVSWSSELPTNDISLGGERFIYRGTVSGYRIYQFFVNDNL